ncbi:MAG: metal ABC transporter substrate-binding protein [Armatimonadetes bacterium]|nr:metal ABC transporter substrate-binding protein [Armatimonadota bacterium]
MYRISIRSLALIVLLVFTALGHSMAGYVHRWTIFPQDDRIKVVASIPETGDIIKQIGGKRVAVVSLIKANQDARKVKVYESMIKAVHEADLLVRIDATYDPWVDEILKRARNSRVAPDSNGYVTCSADAVRLLSDPANRKAIAHSILDGLIRVAPKDESLFRANFELFCRETNQTPASR